MDPTRSINDTRIPSEDDLTEVEGLLSRSPPRKRLGDFELGEEIGRGGMGVVYAAHEVGLGRKVALKILPHNAKLSALRIQRFQVEAKAAAQLNHDNIVPIFHIGEEAGIHYFAMKWIDGFDLAEVIGRARRSLAKTTPTGQSWHKPPHQVSDPATTHVPEFREQETHIDLSAESFNHSMAPSGLRSAHRLAKSVALVGRQVAEALQHAHERGIVHRDIKPSNLLLDTNHRVWVTDFGLAQLQDAPALTQSGDIVGTLRYMSPEQASGRRAFVDHRTDIYSLGVALHELATLRPACGGRTAREILREVTFERPLPIRKLNPRLPRDLETIICKATERNPSDRYQTAGEMAADLWRFANGESLVARRPSRLKRTRDWLHQRPAVTGTLAISALVTMALLAFAAVTLQGSLQVEQEKRLATEALLSTREAGHLQVLSALTREENPGLSLALALAGAEVAPGFAADKAIMSAMSVNHEAQHIQLDHGSPGQLVANPDGTRLVVCCNRRLFYKPTTAAVIDLVTGAAVVELDAAEAITTAAFSPSGRLLVTSGAADTRGAQAPTTAGERRYSPTIIRDARTWLPLKTFSDVQAGLLTGAEFSPDGQLLLLPVNDNTVQAFNTVEWSSVLTLPHSAPVIQAIYSPDGRTIATWSETQTVQLWDAAEGLVRHSIPYEAARPLEVSLSFAPDSKQLLIRGDAGVRLVSVADGTVAASRSEVFAEFGAANDRLYLHTANRKSIYIFSRAIGRVVAECQADVGIAGFCLSSDDQYLTAICDHDLNIFDARDGRRLATCKGHTDWIEGLAFRPFSEQFASVSWDASLRLWNVRSDAEHRTFSQHIEPSGLPIIDYSSDGSRALLATITGQHCGMRQLSDLAQRTQLPGALLDVHPEGYLLVTDDQRVSIWNPTNSKRIADLPLVGQVVSEGALANGQVEAILRTRDGKLLKWNSTTGQVDQLSGIGEFVVCMKFLPNSTKLLVGLQDGRLLLVDEDHHRSEVASWNGPLIHLDIADNGQQALVVSGDNRVSVLELPTLTIASSFTDAEIAIEEAWFARGDQYVVGHAYTRTQRIGLWQITDGTRAGELAVQGVRQVALNANRTQLAIASPIAGARLWDLASQVSTAITDRPTGSITFAGNQVLLTTERQRQRVADSEAPSVRVLDPGTLIAWEPEQTAIRSEALLGFNASDIVPLPAQEDAFVVCGRTFGAEIVDVATGVTQASLMGQASPLAAAAFAPNDQSVLTIAADGKLQLHELNTGKRVELGQHASQLIASALSPDRKVLLTTDLGGQTRQWDLLRGTSRERTPGGPKISQHVIAASGNLAATVFSETNVQIWDLRTGEGNTYQTELPIRHLDFAPDESSLAFVCSENEIRPNSSQAFALLGEALESQLLLLKLPSGQLQRLPVDSPVAAAQFVDSGRRLVALDCQHRLTVWDPATLERQLVIDTTPRCLGLLATEPTSTHIFASARNRLTAWDSVSGQQILDLPIALPEGKADGPLRHWTVRHPESDWLVVYSDRSAIRYPSNPYRYATENAPRGLSPEEKSHFLTAQLSAAE